MGLKREKCLLMKIVRRERKRSDQDPSREVEEGRIAGVRGHEVGKEVGVDVDLIVAGEVRMKGGREEDPLPRIIGRKYLTWKSLSFSSLPCFHLFPGESRYGYSRKDLRDRSYSRERRERRDRSED